MTTRYKIEYRAPGETVALSTSLSADGLVDAVTTFAAANPDATIVSAGLDGTRYFEARMLIRVVDVPPDVTDDDLAAGALARRIDDLITVDDDEGGDEDDEDAAPWRIEEVEIVVNDFVCPVSTDVYEGDGRYDTDQAAADGFADDLLATASAAGKTDLLLVRTMAEFAASRPGLAQAMIEHVAAAFGVAPATADRSKVSP